MIKTAPININNSSPPISRTKTLVNPEQNYSLGSSCRNCCCRMMLSQHISEFISHQLHPQCTSSANVLHSQLTGGRTRKRRNHVLMVLDRVSALQTSGLNFRQRFSLFVLLTADCVFAALTVCLQTNVLDLKWGGIINV